ncbi:hypothetical protein [Streptacidiphilus carbonis]|uniref:hypothetical protein n=1 Tax=Streptacidiphilus carbonis TaxID=105422 RepID=UPI0005A7104C|nr:hypothetical protein [Streptacidiphilus carbonis]
MSESESEPAVEPAPDPDPEFEAEPVPLPDADRVDLRPPDRAETVRIIRGLKGALSGGGGLTELQKLLLRAVSRSMTGFEVDPDTVEPLGARGLAESLAARNEIFRTRVLQLMVLGELVLNPLPEDVCLAVDGYAHALGVDDGMREVAKDYAEGALGLALTDFERNGYTARWDADSSSQLHARSALTEPWQQVADDPALAARWAALAHCPEGSLGLGVHRFYQARGFVHPGLPDSAPPYLAQHDWVHVVADYGTTLESELEVFGLIGRAIPDPRGFSLLAMVLGLFETGLLERAAGLFEADAGHLSREGVALRLGDAMRRGAVTGADLLGIDWFELADIPVDRVRRDLGLPDKDPLAVRAGSVSPWGPGGISPFQRRSGMKLAAAEGRRYDSFGADL